MKGWIRMQSDKQRFETVKDRFRVELVVLLLASSLNMLVILTIGFLVGPQINETYSTTLKNYEINKANYEVLHKVNALLNQAEQRAKVKAKTNE